MSQDFDLHPFNYDSSSNTTHTVTKSIINIIISCHSHAPLQEFWDRLHHINKQDNRELGHDNNMVPFHSLSDDTINHNIHRRMRKIAITMACCSNYANLNDDLVPLLEFDDFEVYSPKRRIKIYYSDDNI